ncbi:MAG TPA: L,D-transpeptidase [Clostridia bacterium]|nr:L,D-transpeptidase [Clostridia bacterium]
MIFLGGKTDTPSPISNWKISFKALWGEGYVGRFMGINCPWGQFGMHGTPLEDSIGKKSSHGCIRIKIKDVEELYSFINVGTTVTIIDGEYGDFGKGFRYLESGMYGLDVFEIQKKLRNLGLLKHEPK